MRQFEAPKSGGGDFLLKLLQKLTTNSDFSIKLELRLDSQPARIKLNFKLSFAISKTLNFNKYFDFPPSLTLKKRIFPQLK